MEDYIKLELPTEVEDILTVLNNYGCEGYVVGGCVRDSLMGRVPHDWDICTDALPEFTMKVFSGLNYKVIETGIKYGTITVIPQNSNNQYEITTYRIDGIYEDRRHPKNVTFIEDITFDLMRRDFTINAIAYNPMCGFVDPFGGMDDIKNRLIRCVGSASDRFIEDPLRILRAVRFSLQLNFNIINETYLAIMRYIPFLSEVSAERIRDEIIKSLKSDKLKIDGICLLYKCLEGIYPKYFSCTGNPYKAVNTQMLSQLSLDDPIEEKLAIFFRLNSNLGAEIGALLRKLRFDNKTIRDVQQINDYFDIFRLFGHRLLNNDASLKSLMRNGLIKNLFIALNYYGTYAPKNYDEVVQAKNRISEIICNNECYSLDQLAVSGNDIINEFGVKGKVVGEYLEKLLALVCSGKLENDKEILIEYLKKMESK